MVTEKDPSNDWADSAGQGVVAGSSQVPTRLRSLCLEKAEGKTSGSNWVPQSGRGSSQEMLSVTGTHGCFDFFSPESMNSGRPVVS